MLNTHMPPATSTGQSSFCFVSCKNYGVWLRDKDVVICNTVAPVKVMFQELLKFLVGRLESF